MRRYVPEPPNTASCQDCGQPMDWINSRFYCNWCCKSISYERQLHHSSEYVSNDEHGVERFVTFLREPNDFLASRDRHFMHACTHAGDISYLAVQIVKDCVDCLWVDRYFRRAKKRPLTEADRSFIFYVYVRMLTDTPFPYPENPLIERIREVKLSVRTLLPIAESFSLMRLVVEVPELAKEEFHEGLALLQGMALRYYQAMVASQEKDEKCPTEIFKPLEAVLGVTPDTVDALREKYPIPKHGVRVVITTPPLGMPKQPDAETEEA